MLLLDAGPLDLLYGIVEFIKAVGVALLFGLAFLGIRTLIRLRHHPTALATWVRAAGAALLLLPAGNWLFNVLYEFGTDAQLERQEAAADVLATQQCVGWYQLGKADTLASGTVAAFDLHLKADGRYTWKTTLPQLDSTSLGNWSVEIRDFHKPYISLISSSNSNSHVLSLHSCTPQVGSCWQGQARGIGYGTPGQIGPYEIWVQRQAPGAGL